MKKNIVMIHGMCLNSRFWNGGFKEVFESAGYKCICLNLMHHNNNSEKLSDVGLLDYVNQVVALVEELEEPPILMGHSMGGLIALLVAERTRIKSLVLLSPATPAGIFILYPTVVKCFWGVIKTPFFWKKTFRFSRKIAGYYIFNRLSKEEGDELYKEIVPDSGKVVFQIGFWFFDPKKSSKINFKKINAPVLILAGGKDRITPASSAETLQRKISDSDSKLFIYPDNAHILTKEVGWEKKADEILMWLSLN